MQDIFVTDAVEKYSTHLRALGKARVGWEAAKAAAAASSPPPPQTPELSRAPPGEGEGRQQQQEQADGKHVKVQFDLPDYHRSDGEIRSRRMYRRSASWYTPGRWACGDTAGFWDTSCANDRCFLYEVELTKGVGKARFAGIGPCV